MANRTKRKQNNQQPNQAASSRWPLWVGIGSVVAVTLLVVYAVYATVTSADGIAGLELFGPQVREHSTEEVDYTYIPPVGGLHSPVWQNCGIYDQPVADENAVHSMEHGAVWIAYQAELAEEEVEQLRELVRGRRYMLLSPYEGLPSPVVASAWGVQLALDEADDDRLRDFLAEYVQGPQTPEPGAACSGGVGEPLG